MEFASARERRLWLWTVAVAGGIFATLGLARTLADSLRSRGLLDASFALAFVVVLVAIGAMALRARPGGIEIGIALGVAAVYMLLFVRMGIPEERTHLVEYAVLAGLAHEALLERGSRHPALVAAALASLAGVVDECIQLMLPSRVFDPVDIGFNVLAAVLAVAAHSAIRRAHRT